MGRWYTGAPPLLANTQTCEEVMNALGQSRNENARASNDGFGMIEIVVSMFLLSLIAMALIPVLIQGMRVSVLNTTVATATQILSRDIEEARARGTNCADLLSFSIAPVTPIVDGRGGAFEVHRTPVVCPAAGEVMPTTVTFSVSVTRVGDAAELAGATTLILVR